MENLFTVIVLTTTSVILFSMYYLFRGLRRKYEKRRIEERIWNKTYEDEKAYIRNYLRILLGKLKLGELSWILISSRLYPHDKLEITINPPDGSLLVKTRFRQLTEAELEILKKIGVISTQYGAEINSLYLPINTKIVTDIIYYCFEKIGKQGRARNIKISTSGG